MKSWIEHGDSSADSEWATVTARMAGLAVVCLRKPGTGACDMKRRTPTLVISLFDSSSRRRAWTERPSKGLFQACGGRCFSFSPSVP